MIRLMANPDRPSRQREKQNLRARARRGTVGAEEAAAGVGHKPVSQWDDLELAHGRPRAHDGTFRGETPKWITPLVNEEAERRFRQMLKSKANVVSINAVQVLEKLMMEDGVTEDDRGRIWHRVAPGVRADVAKYLMDHVIGKATQPVDVNANVKLVGLLANVVTQGDEGGEGEPSVGFADRVEFVDAEATEKEPEEDAM